MTLAQARRMADLLRTEVAMGNDPSQERTDLRAVPTFAEFTDKQLLPFFKVTKRSWKWDASLLRYHLIPAFGTKTAWCS